ncbi:hypothetical protein QBC46DRAFT_347316 [Diplogelasinospora grovesii]|uniref:Uncharacterized protein n=1 Tax=Diplogelasinospora grovesii TaxID=303347 RepID=A0AAN6MWQ1_9PEZI|nr:hypothetical protein QBC46DRAFT_347316 [Diplogelasinospora grovesii]
MIIVPAFSAFSVSASSFIGVTVCYASAGPLAALKARVTTLEKRLANDDDEDNKEGEESKEDGEDDNDDNRSRGGSENPDA